MIKRFLSALLLLVVFTANAYDSSYLDDIDSIFWQPQGQKGAVVYHRFDDFYALRMFIDSTLMTAPARPAAEADYAGAEKLILMLPQRQQVTKVQLSAKHLLFDNKVYTADTAELAKWINTNSKRASRGDTTSEKLFQRSVANFGADFVQ